MIAIGIAKEALWDIVTAPIGEEQPNRRCAGQRSMAELAAGEARAERFSNTYVQDDLGNILHKSAAAKYIQQVSKESKNKPGRLRYSSVSTAACIADDKDGTGFHLGAYYQYRQCLPANRNGSEMDIAVHIVQVQELRRCIGETVHPRSSIAKQDKASGAAICKMFVMQPDGSYVHNPATDNLWAGVQLTSLGCEVKVEFLHDCHTHLRVTEYVASNGNKKFDITGMRSRVDFKCPKSRTGVDKPLNKWLKQELSAELEARMLPKSGVKAVLMSRLRDALVEEGMQAPTRAGVAGDSNASLPGAASMPQPASSSVLGSGGPFQVGVVQPLVPHLHLQPFTAPAAYAMPNVWAGAQLFAPVFLAYNAN